MEQEQVDSFEDVQNEYAINIDQEERNLDQIAEACDEEENQMESSLKKILNNTELDRSALSKINEYL